MKNIKIEKSKKKMKAKEYHNQSTNNTNNRIARNGRSSCTYENEDSSHILAKNETTANYSNESCNSIAVKTCHCSQMLTAACID